MKIKNFLHAIKAGKKPFKVIEINRYVFATNEEQCLSKFAGYRVKEVGLLGLIFILWGKK